MKLYWSRGMKKKIVIKQCEDGKSFKFASKVISKEELLERLVSYREKADSISVRDNNKFLFLDVIKDRMITFFNFKNDVESRIVLVFDSSIVFDSEMWQTICRTLKKGYAEFDRDLDDEIKRSEVLLCIQEYISSGKLKSGYDINKILDYINNNEYWTLRDLFNKNSNNTKCGHKLETASILGAVTVLGSVAFSQAGASMAVCGIGVIIGFADLLAVCTFSTSYKALLDKEKGEALDLMYSFKKQIEKSINLDDKQKEEEKIRKKLESFINEDLLELEHRKDKAYFSALFQDMVSCVRASDYQIDRFDELHRLVTYEADLYRGEMTASSIQTPFNGEDYIGERIAFLDLDDDMVSERAMVVLLDEIYWIKAHPYKGCEYELLLLLREMIEFAREYVKGNCDKHELNVSTLQRYSEIKDIIKKMKKCTCLPQEPSESISLESSKVIRMNPCQEKDKKN